MTIRWVERIPLVSAAVALAIALPVAAQIDQPTMMAGPDYDSGVSAGAMSDSHFNTPESDGRPGVDYFDLGAQAFKTGDYRHAVDMYKVAASWAYKPAEYNLGLMYFKGEGVPVDRARGSAWMILAAERGDVLYVKARDLMVTALTRVEFQQTDEIWNQLKPTYGDAVALQRARARWNWVGSHETGTHIAGGIPGYLRVGEEAQTSLRGPLGTKVQPTTAAGLLSAGSMDGSAAYRQFHESDNPYDPVFIKNRTGTATIGPLQQVKSGSDAQPPSKKDSSVSPSTQPPSSS